MHPIAYLHSLTVTPSRRLCYYRDTAHRVIRQVHRPHLTSGNGRRIAVSALALAVAASGCAKPRFVTNEEFGRVSDDDITHPNLGMRIMTTSGAVAGGIVGGVVNIPLLPITIGLDNSSKECYYCGLDTALAPTRYGAYAGGAVTTLVSLPFFSWWTTGPVTQPDYIPPQAGAGQRNDQPPQRAWREPVKPQHSIGRGDSG